RTARTPPPRPCPTRRSSDLLVDFDPVAADHVIDAGVRLTVPVRVFHGQGQVIPECSFPPVDVVSGPVGVDQAKNLAHPFPSSLQDRKSTRLNSSHAKTSYAV